MGILFVPLIYLLLLTWFGFFFWKSFSSEFCVRKSTRCTLQCRVYTHSFLDINFERERERESKICAKLSSDYWPRLIFVILRLYFTLYLLRGMRSNGITLCAVFYCTENESINVCKGMNWIQPKLHCTYTLSYRSLFYLSSTLSL